MRTGELRVEGLQDPVLGGAVVLLRGVDLADHLVRELQGLALRTLQLQQLAEHERVGLRLQLGEARAGLVYSVVKHIINSRLVRLSPGVLEPKLLLVVEHRLSVQVHVLRFRVVEALGILQTVLHGRRRHARRHLRLQLRVQRKHLLATVPVEVFHVQVWLS